MRHLLASLAACVLLSACAPSFDIVATTLPPDMRVMQLLKEHPAFHHLRDADGRLPCMRVDQEARTVDHADIAVRKVHRAPDCPGDPNVAPVIERFRVPLKHGAILRHDAAHDRYAPLPAGR